MRLDYYDEIPDNMRAYLSEHGWHFSKKMCYWAISKMRDRQDRKLSPKSKEQVDALLKAHGIDIKNDNGYDAVFVYHMCVSDYLGSSVIDEACAARYVKDVLDDVDGYNGIAFTRFLADCSGKGVSIEWEDYI